MKSFIMDKLYKRVEERGVVCLGLDTAVEYIPSHILDGKSIEEAIFEYNKSIIDETLDVVACFKVQIAYYEALGLAGLMAYKKTLEYLRIKDAIIIADIKRGDIMATATQYAKGHFSGDFEADFITLSPYMGMDSIEPYMPYIENGNKGVFVLVRTSNPGAEDIENIDTKEIRERYKNMFFLIPGYGAQGGKAEDVALYLRNGNGGVVNSSRAILLAYKKENKPEEFALCARKEAIRMRDEIRKAVNNL